MQQQQLQQSNTPLASITGPEQLDEQMSDNAPGAEQPPATETRKQQQLQQSNDPSASITGPEQLDEHADAHDNAPGAEQPPATKPLKQQQQLQQSNAPLASTPGPEQLDEQAGNREVEQQPKKNRRRRDQDSHQCKETEQAPAAKKKPRKQQPLNPADTLPTDAAAPASPAKKKLRARKGGNVSSALLHVCS